MKVNKEIAITEDDVINYLNYSNYNVRSVIERLSGQYRIVIGGESFDEHQKIVKQIMELIYNE